MAKNTQAVYLGEFKAFVNYFKGEDYRYISRDKIIEYLARLYDAGYSPSKINQSINAIKFFKEKILGQKRTTYFLKRPRRQKFIPTIISPQQIKAVIGSPYNLKHQVLLFMIYDNGLRKGELINLKLSDLSTKCINPYFVVRGAKQGGDRLIYFSGECLARIKTYYKQFKPQTYLFEGQFTGKPISGTTIAKVLDKAIKQNNIKSRFRVHDLRHNFATHCLIAGTDIYHLSKILGHKRVETTQKYYAHLLPSQVVIKRPEPQEKETKIIHLKTA